MIMNKEQLELSAVAAAGEGLGSQHGGLSPRRVVPENVLPRSRVRRVPGPVVTIVSLESLGPLVPLVPHGSLVAEGLARVEIRGFPGGVNPESNANGRAESADPAPPIPPRY